MYGQEAVKKGAKKMKKSGRTTKFPKEMLKDPGKAICMFVKKDEIRKC